MTDGEAIMEFVEVFKQAQRMCIELECCCIRCPVSDENGFCLIKPWANNVNPGEAERRVMAWAKKHPEPFYETWAELLYQDFLIWCQEKHPGRAKDEKAWFDYIYETHIPAEIAEKLGLKPKEANGYG